jgi:hypothetical protein
MAMAALRSIAVPNDNEAAGAPLSPFEVRCLLRHVAECHELLELTILGADEACERAGGSIELRRLRALLEMAEALIERAERMGTLQQLQRQRCA